MKRVLIRPSFHDWCGNRLFSQGTSHEGVYRGAFSRWREEALASGFAIDTWDVAPLCDADVMWFLDLPPSYQEFCRIRKQLKPECRLVLQILETPALAWNVFNAQNRRHFDCVVTYETPSAKVSAAAPKTIHYRLPNTFRLPVKNPSFSERKGLIAINSNRVEGIWAMRQPGLSGLPLVGKVLSGWAFSFADLQRFVSGELYSGRRNFLREAEMTAPGFVDLFGSGWNGEQVSWCPLYRNRPYACWRGRTTRPKDDLCSEYRFALAFENFRGRMGYVSEKIFDAFCAGTVPVYLGEERIADWIPPESFVDAKNFSSYRELLRYLKSCPEREWTRMRDCARVHLEDKTFRQFTDEAFENRMMEALRMCIGQRP